MDDKYTRRLEKIEVQIKKWLPENPGSVWFDDVFSEIVSSSSSIKSELIASLTTPGWDLVNRGGKRWRPLLLLLAAESMGGERGEEAALPLTPLVEFPHNASLIHDDIEDNSDERRGKPAVHLIYGTDTAINAGTFLYFLPLACLSAWEGGRDSVIPNLKEKIWEIWAGHMRALHLGQAMDISWHRDFYSLPALDEYDKMCRLKTGCLARLAAVLGVYLGGAASSSISQDEAGSVARSYGDAAEKLGVGFQIIDDVKNLMGEIHGKKRGDDIVEGKKSLPVLLYLHRYPEKLEFTARCFTAARLGGTKTPEVGEFIAELEKTGILKEALEKGREYIRESRDVFNTELLADLICSMV